MEYRFSSHSPSRGTEHNPANRFDGTELEEEPGEHISAATQIFTDHSRTILSTNDSPDIPFTYSLNPYRGCEHGCVYCYARPTHEYLGLSSGVDFETRIFVKRDAPELLRKQLASPRWNPQPIAISGVTDAYQPIERALKVTRGCLEVFAECLNPVTLITKNALVIRDIDLLSELSRASAVHVWVSITTIDDALAGRMEPRASRPRARLQAVETLAKQGVPVGVLMAPLIPGLTDWEIPRVLKASREHGAQATGFVLVRLPHAVKDLFQNWLEEHAPLAKDRVLGRLRSTRGGKLNRTGFHTRMRGEGELADAISRLFRVTKKRLGFEEKLPELSVARFRRPVTDQLVLFE